MRNPNPSKIGLILDSDFQPDSNIFYAPAYAFCNIQKAGSVLSYRLTSLFLILNSPLLILKQVSS